MTTPGGQDGRLTVVLPTYRHGQYIRAALDSLIAQTRKPDRLLIIDDASEDDTAAIIAGYAERYPWFEIVTNPDNRGVVACLNAGIADSDSEYVTFLASDDFILPTLYEKTLQLLDAHPVAGLCAVLTRWVDETGRPVRQPRPVSLGREARYIAPDEIAQALMRHGSIFGGNGTVYRTSELREAGDFDPNLGAFCDGYAIQLLSLRHGACYVPEILAAWRRSSGSYAVATQTDPHACRAILDAIMHRIWQTDEAVFPVAYRRRLERRLRFTLAAAVVGADPADGDSLREALGGSWQWLYPILRTTRRLVGRSATSLLLLGALRPWDLLPASARHLFAWPAGAATFNPFKETLMR